MYIDFDKLFEGAAREREESKKLQHETFLKMDEEKNRQIEAVNATQRGLYETLTNNYKEQMEQEIAAAKKKVEADIRQKYLDKYGDQEWNDSGVTASLRAIAHSI